MAFDTATVIGLVCGALLGAVARPRRLSTGFAFVLIAATLSLVAVFLSFVFGLEVHEIVASFALERQSGPGVVAVLPWIKTAYGALVAGAIVIFRVAVFGALPNELSGNEVRRKRN